MKKYKRLTYSIGFKVFLYMVLVLSFLTGAASVAGGVYLLNLNAYYSTYEDSMYEALRPAAQRRLTAIIDRYSSLVDPGVTGDLERDSEESGVGYRIIRNGYRIFNNIGSKDSYYTYTVKLTEENQRNYELAISIYDDFPKNDEFRKIYLLTDFLFCRRYSLIIAAAVSAALFTISFIWLLCNAGRRCKQEGIVPGVLTFIPLDVLAVVMGAVALIPFYLGGEYDLERSGGGRIVILLIAVFEVVWCTSFCRDFVLRVKLGKWWRNTLIYRLLMLAKRLLQVVWRALAELVKGMPMIWHVVLITALFTLGEFWGITFLLNGYKLHRALVLWVLEKLILLPIIFYCALAFKKLQRGSTALAQGDLSCKLDTRHLVLDFKDHARNLNRIGDGIAKAVEQKLRSERLKTELITNVSHDLKTPLTSVINYADLLGSEAGKEDGAMEQAKVAEYSEVLLRQSKRLKKLLDDLLEAAKATTGSIEVNPMPCELGVLLTQAAGEYEARFSEKKLELHRDSTEEEIRVMADGRLLWRVFDNLLNNVYKYAQENSRVYLNMEKKDGTAEIIFRNMSKYELNIPAEELEERFARGDQSRHMEGNGLGLSIAKSLVELQGGTMRIVTDGDLFKVILAFPIMAE